MHCSYCHCGLQIVIFDVIYQIQPPFNISGYMHERSIANSFTPINFQYPASPTDEDGVQAPCASGGANATILGNSAEQIYINYLNVSVPDVQLVWNLLYTWYTVYYVC